MYIGKDKLYHNIAFLNLNANLLSILGHLYR